MSVKYESLAEYHAYRLLLRRTTYTFWSQVSEFAGQRRNGLSHTLYSNIAGIRTRSMSQGVFASEL